jgi:hypothetical protein
MIDKVQTKVHRLKKKIFSHPFKSDYISNKGALDVKLFSLIWRILLKHAIKMDSVVNFSAVAGCACCLCIPLAIS